MNDESKKKLTDDLREKGLGELVLMIITENIKYQNRLWDRDSPYKIKEEANRKIREEYLETLSVITGEITRREKEIYNQIK